jgi:extracellular elastinolytic metalloproteinase
MKRLLTTSFSPLVFLSLFSMALSAQKVMPNVAAVRIALDYVQGQQTNKAWDLTRDDVAQLKVQDYYTTEHNGVTHVFIIQHHNGVELHNGIINVNVLPNGEVVYAGNRFIKNFSAAINTTQPALSADEAIEKACAHLKIGLKEPVASLRQNTRDEQGFDVYRGGSISLSDIRVKLRFQKMSETQARLAYDLNIEMPDASDHWSLRIDALDGTVLNKNSWTTHCQVHPKSFQHTHTDACEEGQKLAANAPNFDVNPIGEGTYRVFNFPAESPAHGTHNLVVSPADSLASPFGWHDNNGVAGGEYQITRGNNAHAYLDVNNTNGSAGDEPNGGATYTFDHPFSADVEPDSNRKAATVNLFYTTNMIHDISFRYGFDEAAGNFQMRNYTGAPGINDWVRAEAQDGYRTGNADNANFSTPPDGSNPRMQMYVWNRAGGKLLHVTAPANLVGSYATGTAGFGPTISTTPVSGEVVVINDGSTTPTQGCATGGGRLDGKMVMIDRGGCEFSTKVLNAQRKGAVGVIVCNFENSVITMGAGAAGAQVTIPSLMLTKGDCDRIRPAAGTTLRVSFYTQSNSGPNQLDGDFDNGIIAHEYGHGISNRLTGGRNNTSCLNNGEQGGEGWSDFMTLITGIKAGDTRNTRRGVGTYVQRQDNNGTGIRAYPYSTDMSVNPLTYDDLLTDGAVHAIGTVWATTLWDMYWNMVDVYGFDINWKNTNSGNGKAIKLVMDGMKMQTCNPGFLDARDAILAADRANNMGANQCLIWETFARRGMGVSAKQGSGNLTNDNSENFKSLGTCIKKLKIEKFAQDTVVAGGQILYTIQVINHKGSAITGVVVTDPLQAGLTYLAASASRPVTVANGNLTWNIGNMNNGDTLTLTYRVTTDPTRKSVVQFADNLEAGDANWDPTSVKNINFWELTDIFSRSGTKSIGVGLPSVGSSDQLMTLIPAIRVTGTKPILRFHHYFDTQTGFDGGMVQISTNNGTVWQNVEPTAFFKNTYTGKLAYGTFVQPNLRAFSGQSASFIGSYIDLSPYANQTVKLRFRFGNDTTAVGVGWFVDDVVFMDMLNYNTTARVVSAQNDTASAEVANRGTVVEPSGLVNTNEENSAFQMRVYPNPTSDFVNVNIVAEKSAEARITIVAADGRVLKTQDIQLESAQEVLLPLDLTNFASGVYFVKVSSLSGSSVQKFIKR